MCWARNDLLTDKMKTGHNCLGGRDSALRCPLVAVRKISPNPVSRFEPVNQPGHSDVKLRGAFLPLCVGGADGERVGVRCAFLPLGVLGEDRRRAATLPDIQAFDLF